MRLKSEYLNIHSAKEWASFLRQIDCRIGDGEETAVVLDVRTIGIAGASVGDSRAVIVKGGTMCELTANQKRKPLIGTGMAEPIGFVYPPLDGLLLVGHDGFLQLCETNAITTSIAKSTFKRFHANVSIWLRLPSGDTGTM